MNNNWINLRHEGGENDPLAYVVVSVEIDGQRHEAIRELKGNCFDHSVNMDSLPVPLVPATDNADLRRQLAEARKDLADCVEEAKASQQRIAAECIASQKRIAHLDAAGVQQIQVGDALYNQLQVAQATIAQQGETIATLREALVHQLYDMHMPSMRPCATCERSRKALGADVRFGCGYRRAENDTPEVALSKIAALDAGKETENG
jgi:CheY-like chemotaxis protein